MTSSNPIEAYATVIGSEDEANERDNVYMGAPAIAIAVDSPRSGGSTERRTRTGTGVSASRATIRQSNTIGGVLDSHDDMIGVPADNVGFGWSPYHRQYYGYGNWTFGAIGKYAVLSFLGFYAVLSITSIFSLLSINCIGCAVSVNSIFSINSYNSVMSFGCSDGYFQICYEE
jgi:hypothetical protein